MYWLILIGIPLAAVCAAGFGVHFLDSAWIVRISTVSIAVQVTATLLVFLLPRTMPDTKKYGEQLCPDLGSGQGHLMVAIAFASIAVGAVALASSFIAVRRRVASLGRLLAGIAAAALVPVIFARLLIAALCGYYD